MKHQQKGGAKTEKPAGILSIISAGLLFARLGTSVFLCFSSINSNLSSLAIALPLFDKLITADWNLTGLHDISKIAYMFLSE